MITQEKAVVYFRITPTHSHEILDVEGEWATVQLQVEPWTFLDSLSCPEPGDYTWRGELRLESHRDSEGLYEPEVVWDGEFTRIS